MCSGPGAAAATTLTSTGSRPIRSCWPVSAASWPPWLPGTAVATTGADPTVGLVFYDLKTLLRQIAEGDGKAADEEQEQADGSA